MKPTVEYFRFVCVYKKLTFSTSSVVYLGSGSNIKILQLLKRQLPKIVAQKHHLIVKSIKELHCLHPTYQASLSQVTVSIPFRDGIELLHASDIVLRKVINQIKIIYGKT